VRKKGKRGRGFKIAPKMGLLSSRDLQAMLVLLRYMTTDGAVFAVCDAEKIVCR
jgi:hypothetical protein